MNAIAPSNLAELSDVDLLAHIRRAATDERHATAHLIALLMQIDARRLYLGEGYSSLFTFCTTSLHFSEHAAYGRIEAARAGRDFPIVLNLRQEGEITLTAIGLLRPHLTPENDRDILERARHRSKREVEELVATLRPKPDVPSTVHVALAESRSETTPLAPDRYKIQFTVSRETYEQLRRAQSLMRHSVPSGDPAVIFSRALTLLVAELERTKLAQTDKPRRARPTNPASRHIPAAVRRAVWQRDGGRYAFQGSEERCHESSFIEFHHLKPYADGGEATPANIELRCRAHNVYEAKQYFAPQDLFFSWEADSGTRGT